MEAQDGKPRGDVRLTRPDESGRLINPPARHPQSPRSVWVVATQGEHHTSAEATVEVVEEVAEPVGLGVDLAFCLASGGFVHLAYCADSSGTIVAFFPYTHFTLSSGNAATIPDGIIATCDFQIHSSGVSAGTLSICASAEMVSSQSGTFQDTGCGTLTIVGPTETPTHTRTPTATPTVTPTETPTATPSMTQTCVPSSDDGVTGHIWYYSNHQPVSNVTVELQGPVAAQTNTGPEGQFSFAGVGGCNIRIEPRKLDDENLGISALDGAYILQAVVGLRTLNVEQRLACDVTANGTVSALDAAMIPQYKVGLISAFPTVRCGSEWAFIPVPAAALN